MRIIQKIKCFFGFHKWFYAKSYGWEGWYNIFDHESRDLKVCHYCDLEKHIGGHHSDGTLYTTNVNNRDIKFN